MIDRSEALVDFLNSNSKSLSSDKGGEDRAKKLAAALSSDAAPPIWEFYCNDNFLDDEDPFGDERGQTTRKFDHLGGSCRDNKLGLVAYLDPSKGAEIETITFCPDALKGFTGESLKSVRGKTYGKVLGKDDEGKDNFYMDTPYSQGINGAAYGWECVTKINESEDAEAENNGDSFAFYVTAIYLDKNDWSTGEAAAL
ncbi:uncharacterized protein N7473_003641 [Penicillium subrubescens]|uniref:uncharacterized protein n=1 Tax=Penicillium subrubescens TaxID=1316194 RepID=UPI002544F60C|nr:uncharacterized protein N7473_003641 [Penicillium subrubescens]KAJ5906725.1 hypothetical protein N7473_003641 [Penicillium subrubescens]